MSYEVSRTCPACHREAHPPRNADGGLDEFAPGGMYAPCRWCGHPPLAFPPPRPAPRALAPALRARLTSGDWQIPVRRPRELATPRATTSYFGTSPEVPLLSAAPTPRPRRRR